MALKRVPDRKFVKEKTPDGIECVRTFMFLVNGRYGRGFELGHMIDEMSIFFVDLGFFCVRFLGHSLLNE